MYRQTVLPRWRGFNLDQCMGQTGGAYSEDDFRMMSELGFDFVRLALNYKQWITSGDWNLIDDEKLYPIDQAIEWGKKYGLHINLSFHRGPGYSISTSGFEPYRLFRDDEALHAFILHWSTFASRFKSIGDRVSFNLLNEPRGILGQPPGIGPAEHAVVMRKTIQAIREIDPMRLIILDGLDAGQVPPTDLFDLASDGVAISMRAYIPGSVTHFDATWDGNERYANTEPKWPGGVTTSGVWDSDRLHDYFKLWGAFAESAGMGLHCGEGGCYNRTPHKVALSWMEEVLGYLKEINTGIALWNFRGPFGILDSGRADVAYENWHGHQLDRKMVELLRKYW